MLDVLLLQSILDECQWERKTLELAGFSSIHKIASRCADAYTSNLALDRGNDFTRCGVWIFVTIHSHAASRKWLWIFFLLDIIFVINFFYLLDIKFHTASEYPPMFNCCVSYTYIDDYLHNEREWKTPTICHFSLVFSHAFSYMEKLYIEKLRKKFNDKVSLFSLSLSFSRRCYTHNKWWYYW